MITYFIQIDIRKNRMRDEMLCHEELYRSVEKIEFRQNAARVGGTEIFNLEL